MKKLLLLTLLTLPLSGEAHSSISIVFTPLVGFAPLTIHGQVAVEPQVDNKQVCLVWESKEGDSGSSCWDMEGSFAPKTKFYVIHALPAGGYEIVATLYRVGGELRSNILKVSVRN